MIKYYDTISDKQGNVVDGAQVTVTLRSTGALASLFQDDETTPISNPTVTDANGQLSFNVDAGVYDFLIVRGLVRLTKTKVTITGAAGPPGVDGQSDNIFTGLNYI